MNVCNQTEHNLIEANLSEHNFAWTNKTYAN
jgi:hypothetical protein